MGGQETIITAGRHLFRIKRHVRLLLVRGLVTGVLIALAGIMLASTPAGRWLEEDIGLTSLFNLRGERPAPRDVVVVSIDSRSSQQLGLPNKPRKWPRSLHGRLIDKIAANGASVIAFDVIFDEERDKSDNLAFAGAMQRAQNVILFQYLKKFPIYQEDSQRKQKVIGVVERLVPPVPVLRHAALGLALFPLPKVPARVNHFRLYTPALGNAATLPVLAQLVHSLEEYESVAHLLKDELAGETSRLPGSRPEVLAQRNIHTLASTLRELFIKHPGLAPRLLNRLNKSQPPQKLHSLINTLAMPDSAYLNFYGPPGSIKTIPYYKVLASTPGSLDLKGKAVFVGFAEGFLPEQADAFYTVFTDPQSGLDLSGVEIGATALSNLLDNSIIRASGAGTDILVLLSWGILLGLGLRMLPGHYVFPGAIVCSAGYGWLVYQQFAFHYDWYPLAIPLLIQAPLAVVASLIWKYHDVQHERRNIRRAFGYHLPIKVVDQLARGMDHITAAGQHVHGIVLATDAAQYTRLSEQMAPAELRDLMNRYYEALFTPIRQAGGIISDVVGDAALAIWASSRPDAQQRQRACRAVLDIVQAVDKFNRDNVEHALPTRLGLHFGEVVMGHIGAVDHYEYRAVGDIVNTATRIEGLNKQLGTRIIVSQEVLEGVEGYVTRELGRFLLKGKRRPLTLHELIGRHDEKTALAVDYDLFRRALYSFQMRRWEEAAKGFEQFMAQRGEDGPSRYYLDLVQHHAGSFQDDWDGVISLAQK